MKNSKIERDAETLTRYMTLESIEKERREVQDVMEAGDGYEGLEDILAVLKRAEELLGGSEYEDS